MNFEMAKGKTEFSGKLTKHLRERRVGLSWKEAWALRLNDLGGKNRLPRGFQAQILSDRAVGREVVRQIKLASAGSFQR
jgi:hypothetical protein